MKTISSRKQEVKENKKDKKNDFKVQSWFIS